MNTFKVIYRYLRSRYFIYLLIILRTISDFEWLCRQSLKTLFSAKNIVDFLKSSFIDKTRSQGNGLNTISKAVLEGTL